jgi:hypothetical protein
MSKVLLRLLSCPPACVFKSEFGLFFGGGNISDVEVVAIKLEIDFVINVAGVDGVAACGIFFFFSIVACVAGIAGIWITGPVANFIELPSPLQLAPNTLALRRSRSGQC